MPLPLPSSIPFAKAGACGNDSRGHHSPESERIADGKHPLSDARLLVGHLHGGEFAFAVDLEQGEVILGIAGHHLRAHGRALGEADAEDVDLLDDVVVGDDVAARVEQHPGAHAVDAVLRGGERKELLRGGPHDRAFAVDVDDGAAGALDRFNHRRPARLAGMGRD